LINKKGEILWRERGVYDDSKAQKLTDCLLEYFQ